jgi:hypothetical protein
VHTMKNSQVTEKTGNLLSSLVTDSFSRKTLYLELVDSLVGK